MDYNQTVYISIAIMAGIAIFAIGAAYLKFSRAMKMSKTREKKLKEKYRKPTP